LFCQEVQSFVDLAGVPAINELRNAGKHLIDALDNNGAIKSQIDLNAGTAHCRRACYEAYEAGILAALAIIEKFKLDFGDTVISGVVPDYAEVLQKAQRAQKAIEVGRHPEFDRAADHATRMDAFRDLRDCAERLDLGRDDMNKKVAAERKTAARLTGGLILAAITIAVTVGGFAWQASGYWVPWHHATAEAEPIPKSASVANVAKPAAKKPVSAPASNSN
jgi:hypothetical protein